MNSWLSYRHLVKAIFIKELRSRYIGSLLGPLWLVVPPVFLIFIYTIIFSKIMHARLPGISGDYGYSAFLCGGLLIWNLFVEILQRSKGVFIENSNLIKKISFPQIILFLPIIITALFNSAVLFLVFLVFATILGMPPGWSALSMIPPLLVAAVLATVAGIVVAVLNVFVRDVAQLIDSLLQFGFWATPIVYPLSILPGWAADLILLNPLTGLVMLGQNALTGQPSVDWSLMYNSIYIALALFLLAGFLYRKSRPVLSDYL